ncbi:hypothetical protein FDG2_2080 [Candidatus Protofrankia californiensis]|uniref:Uncharacterized protein n=1 Tax=Candidatus Protofrankia californiensis TaxID=1839754 RepID=A0A1C3NWZ7_9ACTN|nr:hypothetical protein FDG2_2080 [Candidatus Protofrankia californiensis]
MSDPTEKDVEDYESWYEMERPDDVDPIGTWQMWIDRAERAGDVAKAERLRREGPPPEPGISPLTLAPMVLAVAGVGGDPGGAIGVALAALREPLLALVITIGDGDGERARFTRYLLDLLGRSDVAVVAGAAGQGAGSCR